MKPRKRKTKTSKDDGKRKVNRKIRLDIVDKLKEGWSPARIANEFNVNQTNVRNIIKNQENKGTNLVSGRSRAGLKYPKFSKKKLGKAFKMISDGLKRIENEDDDTERFNTAKKNVDEALACYMKIYEELPSESMLDHFEKLKPEPL